MCVTVCLLLVVTFAVSFSYGTRHLAPISIRTNDISPNDSWFVVYIFTYLLPFASIVIDDFELSICGPVAIIILLAAPFINSAIPNPFLFAKRYHFYQISGENGISGYVLLSIDMFEICSIMIIRAGTRSEEIYRVDVDADTQKAICSAFSTAQDELVSSKTRVEFDGSYKPHSDGFLAIAHFQLPDAIMDAIRDPLGVPPYQKQGDDFPEIKAIFVGERTENEGTRKFIVG